MSADPEQEYFCDGLAEELIDALARLDGLRVVARTSAFQFKGQSIDVAQIGQQLRVRFVLEGSVRKSGNRLRINAQLINTDDGYHVWSERYDRVLEDIFEIQDDISRAILDKLKPRLIKGGGGPVIHRYTADVDAYSLYLKGRHHLHKRTPESFRRAANYFEPGFPFYLPRMAPLYTREPPSARNFVPGTIVQLQRPLPQPALTCDRLEPLLSDISQTPLHTCALSSPDFLGQRSPAILPAPAAPRSSAACRRTAAGSDALLPAGASSTAHASPAGPRFSPAAAGDS